MVWAITSLQICSNATRYIWPFTYFMFAGTFSLQHLGVSRFQFCIFLHMNMSVHITVMNVLHKKTSIELHKRSPVAQNAVAVKMRNAFCFIDWLFASKPALFYQLIGWHACHFNLVAEVHLAPLGLDAKYKKEVLT